MTTYTPPNSLGLNRLKKAMPRADQAPALGKMAGGAVPQMQMARQGQNFPSVQGVNMRPGMQGANRGYPGVAGRLQGLLASDSPYLAQARKSGERYANRRGLLNSSIAGQASEQEAIQAALPIAQADAGIASQERLQRRQIGSQEIQQQRQIRSQELMQKQGLSSKEAIAQADRELTGKISDDRLASEAETREASKRIATQQVVTKINSDYQQALDRIDANINLPPAARAEAQKRAAHNRDVAFSLFQQLSELVLEWPTYGSEDAAEDETRAAWDTNPETWGEEGPDGVRRGPFDQRPKREGST